MKTKKKITVFTSGSFDLFHKGHLNLLERSKKLGDFLIVSVSTDKLILDYKKIKPIVPYRERVKIIRALKCVNKTIPQTQLTDISDLKRHNVDIITIGSDWKGKYEQLEGVKFAKKKGIKVIYLPYTKGISTSLRIKKILDRAYELISSRFERGISKIY